MFLFSGKRRQEAQSNHVEMQLPERLKRETFDLGGGCRLEVSYGNDEERQIRTCRIVGAEDSGSERSVDLLAGLPENVLFSAKQNFRDGMVHRGVQSVTTPHVEVSMGHLEKRGGRLTLLQKIERAKLLSGEDAWAREYCDRLKPYLEKEYSLQHVLAEGDTPVGVTIWQPVLLWDDKKTEVRPHIKYVPEPLSREGIAAWVEIEAKSWAAALERYQDLKKLGFNLEPDMPEHGVATLASDVMNQMQQEIETYPMLDAAGTPRFSGGESYQIIHRLWRDISEKILAIVKDGNGNLEDIQANLVRAKIPYLRQAPEHALDTEVLFGMYEFLAKQREIEKDRFVQNGLGYRRRYRPRVEFEDLAEYQYLFSHYLLVSKRAADVKNLWNTLFGVAKQWELKEQAGYLKSGIIGQVAAIKALRACGFDTQLSAPSEDAKGIDAWIKQDGQKSAAL